MSSNASPTEPLLALPGAGLPQPELTVARLLVRWGRWGVNPAQSAAAFTRECATVLALARGCPPERAGRRVLIKRLAGMEDSSRFWSIYMTADHLRIVNQGIGGVIEQLARDEVPARATSTADVKPRPDVGEPVLGEFEQVCARFEEMASGVKNWRTRAKHPHPWFGPMDAGDWYYMAGFHMGLHRQQMKRILEGMKQAA